MQQPKKEEYKFLGKRSGYVFAIFFPDYAEYAPFLSNEAREQFLSDYGKAITNSLTGLVCATEVQETTLAIIAIDETPKQTPEALTKTLATLDKELMTWVGTFGRTGMPPLKYKMGVARGEMTIAQLPPKVIGPALGEALEIANKICLEFDVRIAATGDLVRASTDSVNWIDLDDWRFTNPDGAGKVVRIFSKLTERLEPDEIQLLRAARKAYFLQNWDDAAAKFDRLIRIASIRALTAKYVKRIEILKARQKVANWDGVFRNDD